jgi:hypothetical protein
LKNGKLSIYHNLAIFEKAENVQISATCVSLAPIRNMHHYCHMWLCGLSYHCLCDHYILYGRKKDLCPLFVAAFSTKVAHEFPFLRSLHTPSNIQNLIPMTSDI